MTFNPLSLSTCQAQNASSAMEQVTVVGLSEGPCSPQVYKVSVGVGDTKHTVMKKLSHQLYSRNEYKLDTHDFCRIPNYCLWGNISDLSHSQFNSVSDGELSVRQKGYSLLCQRNKSELKRGKDKRKTSINKEQSLPHTLSMETDSTQFNTTPEHSTNTQYNLHISSKIHSISPKSQRVNNHGCKVVTVSETDTDSEDKSDSDSEGVLSGLHLLVESQRRRKSGRTNKSPESTSFPTLLKENYCAVNNVHSSADTSETVFPDTERQCDSFQTSAPSTIYSNTPKSQVVNDRTCEVLVSETDTDTEGDSGSDSEGVLSGLRILVASQRETKSVRTNSKFLENKSLESKSFPKFVNESFVMNSKNEAANINETIFHDTERQCGSVQVSSEEVENPISFMEDNDISDEGVILERKWEDSFAMSLNEYGKSDSVEAMESETMKINGMDDIEGEVVNSDDVIIVDSDSSSSNRRLSSRLNSRRMLTASPVLVKCGGIELTQRDLDTLHPYCWLNDQVINSYMGLLMETYGTSHRVYIMSTFFYAKLSRNGYRGVKRWLKKVNMNTLRLLLVPIHLGVHWAIAAIDFKLKRIHYFDSLNWSGGSCLKRLRTFLVTCSLTGKLKRTGLWKLSCAKGIPRQHNGSDCGVFMCQFARWLCSFGKSFKSKYSSRIPFSQKNMLQIRKSMLQELRTGTLISSL